MQITQPLIEAATWALSELLTFKYPADTVMSYYFRDHKILGHRDRGWIADTAFTVLRRKRLLDHLTAPDNSPRRLLLAMLVCLQGMSQRQLAPFLKHGEAEWIALLKSQSALRQDLSLAEQADFPDWLAERLLAYESSEKILALARGLNKAAPLDLRVNLIKTTREAVLEQFATEGIECEPTPYSPVGIRLQDKPILQRYPLFISGAIEVQDEGSQLLGYLLQPKRSEMVVDFCAGAGGKTLLLGAMMRSTGRLYAFDIASKRLAKMKVRVARSGLSNVHPICIDTENDIRIKRLAGKIDRVLVDAPCSGLGTLRRNPDLKWRQRPESVVDLSRKQHDILKGASRLVKPGGRLVYATCSILREENEDITAAFLVEHPEFTLISAEDIFGQQKILLACGEEMHLSPHEQGTDGFYAAVFERKEKHNLT